MAYFVENPDTCWFWSQKRWKRWRSSLSAEVFRCCFCRFGTAWRKGTRFATNTRLARQRMMCTCKKKHVQLRGWHPVCRIPWTAVAQPYPRGLCRLLALALCQRCGWIGCERLDVAGCSRTGSLRAGEAQHPGPRRRVAQRHPGGLAGVQLVTACTLALEARGLSRFQEWCRERLPTCELDCLFAAAPLFAVQALEVHAEWMFQNGGALGNLRHLILAAQHWIPSTRPLTAPAWEMVSRRELLTPVQHRPPIPEVVVRAMCAVAWQFKWWSWVGATVLAFYGAGRLGKGLEM